MKKGKSYQLSVRIQTTDNSNISKNINTLYIRYAAFVVAQFIAPRTFARLHYWFST